MLKYLDQKLREELSPRAYRDTIGRVPPINLLKKLVDKLAKIYNRPPNRVIEGNQTQKDLFDWYAQSLKLNESLQLNTEFYNLHKASVLEPFLHQGKPRLRSVPMDRITFYSDDKVDPTNPTMAIKYMGEMKDYQQDIVDLYYVYTKEEFMPITSKGEVETSILMNLKNEGINPYGELPFIYANMSKTNLLPIQDSDTLRMTLLFPILMADLNYSVKYQAFSIIYGIDVDDESIEMNPSAFWKFNSDPTKDKQPQIGVIKPQVDIDQVLSLIQTQLAFWLNTRGIKSGDFANIDSKNYISGFSKIVDEMDTSEERQKQVPVFEDVEQRLYTLIFKNMHPYWVKTGQIENKTLVTPDFYVSTEFYEQKPASSRNEMVDAVTKEMAGGLISRKRAIKKLNPEMTDEEIEELIVEIDQERTVEVPMEETTEEIVI